MNSHLNGSVCLPINRKLLFSKNILTHGHIYSLYMHIQLWSELLAYIHFFQTYLREHKIHRKMQPFVLLHWICADENTSYIVQSRWIEQI